MLNSTLLHLVVSSLERSPFFVMPPRASAAKLSLGHIRASAFSSNFLAAGHRFGHFSINRAMFTKFLATPIMVRSTVTLYSLSEVKDPVPLHSLSESTAPVTTESFTAESCTFSRNTTPDVGAAIHVESAESMTGDVKNCLFTSNTASFGGAIFFSAAAGTLNISDCQLEHNEADAGAHMLISCATLEATNVDLSFGSGGTCVELSQIKTKATFTSCNFFRNLGTFCTVAGMPTTLESCCFMNYTDDGRSLSSDKLFSGTGQVTLTTTFLNGDQKKQGPVQAEAVTFTPVQEPTEAGSVCRLVPTPSATMNVTFSTAAIFIIVSCAFFVLVSIIGILIVVCCNSKRNDEELLEEKESSSSGKGKAK